MSKDASKLAQSQYTTSRRALEQQLQESIDRYELAAKATSDVVYDLDLSSATVTWSDALYTEFGYKRTEPANYLEWWAGHIHPDDALRVEHEITNLLENNQTKWTSEYRFLKADGNYVHVRDRAFVMRNAKGEPSRIIGSLMDITRQKQLEQAKDEFISLVSHQLRTPLTSIRLFSDMLTDGTLGELNEAQVQYVKNINHASERMLKLVNDILSISRLELGRIHVEPTMTDINKLIQQTIDELQQAARKKGAEIKFTPTDKAANVLLDPVIFSQAINILLENAIRYTRPDKGRIAIGISSKKSGLVMTVTDNGIGIPASSKEFIFSRFYRADNAIEHEHEGTGLGLYLVRLITDSFGGKAWYESQTGKGTSFHILIPTKRLEPIPKS